jgi:glycosyltransferase involved in cell wall biosynthesis
MKTVIIIQRVLPHYRIPFFKKLKDNLFTIGIDLKLVYGQEHLGSVPKTVSIDEPWAYKIHNVYLNFFNIELVWQPCLQLVKGSDLIIFEQANRFLVNYLLLSRLAGKGAKIAYWGHGKNFQAKRGRGVNECLKRRLIGNVDWWFAYSDLTANILKAERYPETRISVVRNSIDTETMIADCKSIAAEELIEVKRNLGIESDNICVYCGGMYSDKKLDFLIDACFLIRERVADFHMVFVGDGPMQQFISDACSKFPWIHYVGPKYGKEKATYLKTAKALLMPGPIGLVVLDCFISGVPLITTNIQSHGPEIDYVDDGVNGIVTAADVNSYAAVVAEFLCSSEQQEKLKKGCADGSQIYTIDNMIRNFSEGVRACLNIG